MKLTNKVVVVTGAGRGIGRAIALECANQNSQTVICSRTQKELDETAAQIRSLSKPVVSVCVDISKKPDVDRLVKTTLDTYGCIDVLVNNAGVIGPIGSIVDNDLEKWVATINTNLIGTVNCCKAFLPYMVAQRRGKIINLSGGGATSPRPRFSAYATSKSAIVGLTATLAEELKEYNIQVNAIAPGAIYSRLHEEVLAAGLLAGEKELALSKKLKLNAADSLKAAAECAVFLASNESGDLTGRVLSAVWDNWRELTKNVTSQTVPPDLYTMRRIDNVLYTKIQNWNR